MNWNKHSDLTGSHAFLSASKYHWINYDDNKLIESYNSYLASEKGTELHEFASRCIALGQRLSKSQKSLNSFVNDAIGYKMQSEQVLYFSPNCYGTADAISFRNRMLRIHDLKTGKVPAHMEQLMVYAALFCLEYKVKPGEITMELRLYQNDEVLCHNPDATEIAPIIDKIITFNKLIDSIKEEA